MTYMRRIGLFVLLGMATMPLPGLGQSRTAMDSVRESLVQYFNAGQTSRIYALCSPSFQGYMREGEFADWLSGLRHRWGSIRSTDRQGVSEGFTIYRTQFDHGIKNVWLALDDRGRISGLAIRDVPPPAKAGPVPSNNPLRNAIDSLVEKTVRPYVQQGPATGLAVGVLYMGKTYVYGYGTTGQGDRVPDGHTLFEIGSITKTFTATLIAACAARGICALEDPVSRYLPSARGLEKAGVPVTLLTLANHTSGLPRLPSDLFTPAHAGRGDDPYARYDSLSLDVFLDTAILRSTPGEHMVYSNLGFGMLGRVLERLSGKPYNVVLQQELCGPLGLTETSQHLDSLQRRRLAVGHNAEGAVVRHWHFQSMAACGALRSSVTDLLRYLQAHIGEGHPDLDAAFRRCELISHRELGQAIGLGWFAVRGLPGAYWHNGGTGGFRTYAAYNRAQKVAVVLLSSTSLPVDQQGDELLRTLSATP